MQIRVIDDWLVDADGKRISIPESQIEQVSREKYETLPVFNPKAAPWCRGQRLFKCASQETSVKGGLEPGSVTVHDSSSGGQRFEAGRDYTIDEEWSTIGAIEDGRIRPGQAVFISYRYGLSRIDSIAAGSGGKIFLRPGDPHICAPRPPPLDTDARLLANVWIPGRTTKLTADLLFPVLETSFPEQLARVPAGARPLLPKTMQKLADGGELRVLAWGDSVTDASYLPDYPSSRWQNQFVGRLKARYPRASIGLDTAAWGGRNSQNFVNEPPGSEHSYKEKVLGSGADLVVSEFVNDAWFPAEDTERIYGGYLADFAAKGMEWIIMTPHYVRPDWMNLDREREIDDDPRQYVKALRASAPRNGVALADASLRWGRLWRQGIPYTTLFLNAINHPDERGMKMYADSLMSLF